MKLHFFTNRFRLKLMLAGAMLCTSMLAIGQGRAVMADAKIGQLAVTDRAGNVLNADYIPFDDVINLRIPVSTLTHGNILPAGSCKIKIGLGSKLAIDPQLDLSTIELSNYFTWTSSFIGSQWQLTGDLVTNMPGGLTDINISLKVKGFLLGKSTITANFLITNHRTSSILSDEDGSNNGALLIYNVTKSEAPPTVITISETAKEACDLKMVFSANSETGISRYEVELSKDAVNYTKVSAVTPADLPSYNSTITLSGDMQAATVFLRIKAVFSNGRTIYSNAVSLNGTCANLLPWIITLYPNPVTDTKSVAIATTQGLFDGAYSIRLMDMAGKLIQKSEVKLNNVTKFDYVIGNIAAGKYLIQIVREDGAQHAVLRFEKL